MEELKVLNEIMIQDTCAKKIHDEVLLKSQERLKSLRDKINDEFNMLHNTFTAMIEKNKKKVKAMNLSLRSSVKKKQQNKKVKAPKT